MPQETTNSSKLSNLDSTENKLPFETEILTNGVSQYTKITSVNSSTCSKRKLILHFDNRNTLQVANSISATTIEQGVNNFLTGVLWGYEDDHGQWEWISTAPSLAKPADCPKCITYFKYLENQIVKESIDRKDLRVRTGSFILNEGAQFRRFYDALIESLRYYKLGTPEREREDSLLREDQLQKENQKDTIPLTPDDPTPIRRRFSTLHLKEVPVNGFRSTNGILYHYVLPSFFRLIQFLQENNRDFVIYLRTMGDDSRNFLHNAQRILSNEHPSFHYSKETTINHEPGRIIRPDEKKIVYEMKFSPDETKEEITDEFLIDQKLIEATGVHAIKDDFNAWRETNYHFSTSKPIWFDPDDPNPRSHHILFDDNFRVIDPNDSIVDIRVMNRTLNKCSSCPFEFYPQLENIFAVQANLYLILADENYFIEQVQLCEENLTKLLQNSELLNAIKQKTFDSSGQN